MTVSADVIARGDVVWLSMDPVAGREQQGDRPHLVISQQWQHSRTRILLCVPMTTTEKPWRTRIKVGDGWAICEQPRSVSVERVRRRENTRHDTREVRALIRAMLED
ncbi:type II toxin-antitoxin system PemK/MazF family toxin [Myceligenerans salitolerans]|uniref:Type II toxin-antitoxin system PemK/MazF family toxin n=1 Tax=Myceligenerans salitolerans TaxID=1230528 RepID=A0ABS3I3W6_9MICO|nr:type II toxin-antitoxin system PemK/MazF family toxin [Myceligenerans salitolerans]MBO0607692.1 type II toxin-antitoxin system PemK/MazF family toxin [Myceligenerans salitolerans]